LSTSTLDIQQGFFKMTMKNQAVITMQLPLDLNPLTQLWHTISSSKILCNNPLSISCLLKLATSLCLGSVEDENVSPLKSSLNVVSVISSVCRYLWLWKCFGKIFHFGNFPIQGGYWILEKWKQVVWWFMSHDSYCCCILLNLSIFSKFHESF
jgi:hypothetical protein